MACKAGKGIPECVLQDEENNPVAQQAVQGTAKAAVFKGDHGCPNLVASILYDTKPVHCLSMLFESIQWVEKEKILYNVDTGKVEALKFLRFNQIDKYNNGMGNVGVANQLTGVYRLDRWVRNSKWWCSMMFLSMGVILINSYKFYLQMCKEEVVKPRYKEQYQFRKAISEYWINP